MDSKVQHSWEDFLNPDVMRPVLLSASIYIAGFEALKDGIIGRIRVVVGGVGPTYHIEL